ncbi:MAG: hypothetical protein VXW38_14970, partial [Bacteroidota bacterium]|nr:hypothetical protein [Bacteroidota bacterium]
EALDEVEVVSEVGKNKQRIMEQEYPTNENLIRTAFGIINKETFAGRLPILTSRDMISNHYHFGMFLMGKFAGLNVVINPDYTFDVYSRSMGSIMAKKPAIYDIDGQIFTTGPSWLDPSTVERVALMPGIMATSRYGSIGAGGVVVVNTKNGTYKPKEKENYDQALLRNNYVKRNVVSIDGKEAPTSTYGEKLWSSGSLQEAKRTYEENRTAFNSHPYFLMEAYRYFYEEQNAEEYADGILNDFTKISNDNPVHLKAMAYVLDAEGRAEKAHELYKRVYTLRPDYAQSFIDMANSYRDLNRPESAVSLYARHSYLLDEGLLPKDSLDLAEIMKREMNNLFTLESSTLKIKQRKNNPDEAYATRLVFEWNDSEAEFDLQFVNPNNQFFNWKHTMEEMPERIRSEKEQGYSMADFLLDDELPGIWKVNATYHGNKQVTPTFVKAIIYRNYGSKLQSKEVKVFQLGTRDINQQLFTMSIPATVVHN